MDRIEQYRVFVQVAELGSFIQAARLMRLPRASVSAAIQQLEANAGTRLLHRTTRKVSLTADGTQLLLKARQVLLDIDDIDQLFNSHQEQVMGRLEVDVPSRIARRLVMPALAEFLRRYPGLQLGLGSTDRAIDLVQEGVDCVIRFGTPQNSSLVVKPLGKVLLVNCASPAYLAEFGVPTQPCDLQNRHVCIGYSTSAGGQETAWEYCVDGTAQAVMMPSRVVVNNAESYIAGCCAGLGLIQVPLFDVQHLLDSGELVEVMAAYRPAPMCVSVLYPTRRQRSRRLGAFIDWFAALMAPHLEP
ncbi:LysR family transcriptional regulator [Pseudomonas sp. PA-1-2A]|uniref:LysR family transcriptional regulator n=1 Tax=Pseudomonas TaxID=286 RepID=UPI0006D3B83E|nr:MULTISPECIES: LysR family transcriptional regulator [Pseudomonas]MBA6043407.1 LysR family transcriptional regulator [Pseudomonas lactis]MBC6627021.1 LysR family transcriptional regulator [Pseudomonas sp.]MBP6954540.1 LysR family transcriptional regulator [Pseudomonas sp.]MBV4511701.1 LysR family transcriptional regulator [Pseudomonas sp. SWRI22]MBY8952686.1 LysR family transcriptional regulator [Pseudomonas carnis]